MSAILIIALYCAAVNLITWIVYGIDKRRAVNHAWRIPESTLLLLALIGGSVGALTGMYGFHHKTMKPRFQYGVPVILALQLAALFTVNYLFSIHIQ